MMIRLCIEKDLLYRGTLVGHQIRIFSDSHNNPFNSPEGDTFEIATSTLDLICHDFEIAKGAIRHLGVKVNLRDKGKLLVQEDGDNYPELTYGKFADYMGYDFMRKMDEDLKVLYNRYNELLFDNRLPNLVCVNWSRRLTGAAGHCKYGKMDFLKYPLLVGKAEYAMTIQLSPQYHERFKDRDTPDNTLIHEMIHVLLPDEHHGRKFKDEMNRINRDFPRFDITVYSHGSAVEKKKRAPLKPKYKYMCVDCYREFLRKRRIDTSLFVCAKCGGSLMMVENLEDPNDVDEFY